MRYIAVTLLFLVLVPFAVRAQTPQPESHASSAPSKYERPNLVAKSQPDSPLRLSVEARGAVDANSYWVVSSVENVSDRDISVYTIRQTPGVNIVGVCAGHLGHLPHDKALRPGQTDRHSAVPSFGPSTRVIYEIDFVEFTDGTTWGADACRISEYLAGERAGGNAAAGRLLELLAGSGPEAVTKTVTEELAGWGLDAVYKEAVRLGLARRGPDGRLMAVETSTIREQSSSEHSPVWELGYFVGTKTIAARVLRAVAKSGPAEIEPTLRLPYDATATR